MNNWRFGGAWCFPLQGVRSPVFSDLLDTEDWGSRLLRYVGSCQSTRYVRESIILIVLGLFESKLLKKLFGHNRSVYGFYIPSIVLWYVVCTGVNEKIDHDFSPTHVWVGGITVSLKNVWKSGLDSSDSGYGRVECMLYSAKMFRILIL
jgi:hypothetical protein